MKICWKYWAIGGCSMMTPASRFLRTPSPDPIPAVFGYHELFHALTIVAVVCQYIAIAFFVIDVR
jgi:predicted membrane channel-forming protein YqfA (hemolysin III family)